VACGKSERNIWYVPPLFAPTSKIMGGFALTIFCKSSVIERPKPCAALMPESFAAKMRS